MKKNYTRGTEQAGVALVVALLFLLVVTILSVTAARNSSFSLQMSGNMQDASSSFQAAEAGLYAAYALLRPDPNTPFNIDVDPADDPIAALSTSPLASLNDPNSVETSITYNTCVPCPIVAVSSASGRNTGSVFGAEFDDCEYYRVDSEHIEPLKARTRVTLNVVYPKRDCP